MAEEADHRLPPPESDEWKPRHARRSKDFGLRVTSRGLFGRSFIDTSWYSTAAGRNYAAAAARRNPWRRILSIETLERGEAAAGNSAG